MDHCKLGDRVYRALVPQVPACLTCNGIILYQFRIITVLKKQKIGVLKCLGLPCLQFHYNRI